MKLLAKQTRKHDVDHPADGNDGTDSVFREGRGGDRWQSWFRGPLLTLVSLPDFFRLPALLWWPVAVHQNLPVYQWGAAQSLGQEDQRAGRQRAAAAAARRPLNHLRTGGASAHRRAENALHFPMEVQVGPAQLRTPRWDKIGTRKQTFLTIQQHHEELFGVNIGENRNN